MEREASYEYKINEEIYTLKIQLNSSDKLLFTLKKKDDNELMYYKKELQYDELLKVFDLKSNRYSDTEKICEYLKRAKEKKNFVRIKIENDKAKFILIKESEDYEEEEYPFDLEQCVVADNELNKTLIKDLKEIREKINDIDEKQKKIDILIEENKQIKDELIKLKEKQKEKNEIDIIVKVDKEEDINKHIFFLSDINFDDKINKEENNLNENVDLFINNKKETNLKNLLRQNIEVHIK